MTALSCLLCPAGGGGAGGGGGVSVVAVVVPVAAGLLLLLLAVGLLLATVLAYCRYKASQGMGKGSVHKEDYEAIL